MLEIDLEVTCYATRSILQWRLTLMGMMNPILELSISSTTIAVFRAMINSSRVIVFRTSERGTTPLISILELSSINESLNGTLNITCVELGTPEFTATTALYVIGNHH